MYRCVLEVVIIDSICHIIKTIHYYRYIMHHYKCLRCLINLSVYLRLS